MKRSKPLKRTPMRRGARKSAYARRPRDLGFMRWVKLQPCICREEGDCEGPIEADHAGERGLGRKADDRTCIPLCRKHHRDRTDGRGVFKGWVGADMRRWLDHKILVTQQRHFDQHANPIPF